MRGMTSIMPRLFLSMIYIPLRSGAERRIQTRGCFHISGFQNRRFWPLKNPKYLVHWAGLEPSVNGLKGLCSTTELPVHVAMLYRGHPPPEGYP